MGLVCERGASPVKLGGSLMGLMENQMRYFFGFPDNAIRDPETKSSGLISQLNNVHGAAKTAPVEALS